MLMNFLHDLFWWIINIDVIVAAAFLLGFLLLLLRKQSTWGRRLVCFAGFITFFIVVVPTGHWMLTCLESRFPPITTIPIDVKGAILLGGSFDRPTMAKRQRVVYNVAAGRFIDFVELAKQNPHLELIFTGRGSTINGVKSEAEIAKDLFTSLGLDLNRVKFEDESKNTIENAILSFKKFNPKPSDKWLLVTSAAHMPRSVGLFRKAGWNVIPYPVDYHTDGEYKLFTRLSLISGFASWQAGIREWAGMTNSYLMGQSDTFYPKPE
jgi:uncharacterized SAM-binding protein YcdF (DUF218 family)